MTINKAIGLVATLAVGIAANMANADELSGTIESIDVVYGTVTVDDEVFTVTDETRGKALEELREGDNVLVVYLPIEVDGAFDALYIKPIKRRAR